MADTKKRKDISSLAKRKPRTNDESFDEDDLDDGKISNKATKSPMRSNIRLNK